LPSKSFVLILSETQVFILYRNYHGFSLEKRRNSSDVVGELKVVAPQIQRRKSETNNIPSVADWTSDIDDGVCEDVSPKEARKERLPLFKPGISTLEVVISVSLIENDVSELSSCETSMVQHEGDEDDDCSESLDEILIGDFEIKSPCRSESRKSSLQLETPSFSDLDIGENDTTPRVPFESSINPREKTKKINHTFSACIAEC